MRIGIIGAGDLGATLAHMFVEVGHDVAIANSRNATSSELAQHHLASAHVVKAFNAMPSGDLRVYGSAGGADHRYGIAVSGDDPAAKRPVFDLIEQLGFEAVDAGTLAEGGRKHQPDAHVYAANLWAEDLRALIGTGSR